MNVIDAKAVEFRSQVVDADQQYIGLIRWLLKRGDWAWSCDEGQANDKNQDCENGWFYNGASHGLIVAGIKNRVPANGPIRR